MAASRRRTHPTDRLPPFGRRMVEPWHEYGKEIRDRGPHVGVVPVGDGALEKRNCPVFANGIFVGGRGSLEKPDILGGGPGGRCKSLVQTRDVGKREVAVNHLFADNRMVLANR